MSAVRCQFSLIPDEDDSDDSKNTVSFKVPLDPDEPDGIKTNIKAKKLIKITAENVLTHVQEFGELKEALDVDDGPPKFKLFESLLHGTVRRDWRSKKTENTPVDEKDLENEDHFQATLLDFTKLYVDEDAALHTKEWLRNVKKPRLWRVHKMLSRIQTINDLIPFMPIPYGGEDTVPRFSDQELQVILQNSGPKSWRDKQVEANIRPTSLASQSLYYEGLRSIESQPRDNGNGVRHHRNNDRNNGNNRNSRNGSRYNGNRGGNGGNKSNDNGNNYRNSSNTNGDPICPVHGTHRVSECTLIKNEKQRFQQRKNERGNRNNQGNWRDRNNQGRGQGQSNTPQRHNYNFRPRNNENNNEISDSVNFCEEVEEYSDNDDDGRMSEGICPDNDDEINAISEDTPTSDLTSGTTVQILDKRNNNKKLKGLFDTGASGNHIKRSALKNVRCTIKEVDVKVTGRYSESKIKQMAVFECKLIDFCSSRKVRVEAYIDDDAIGRHDVIFGKRFCAELGIIMNYKTQTIIWDDLSIPMSKKKTHNRLTLFQMIPVTKIYLTS